MSVPRDPAASGANNPLDTTGREHAARMPLTLTEQLDAMLTGWLERAADTGNTLSLQQVVVAVIPVRADLVEQIRAFCDRWEMTVTDTGHDAGAWRVLKISGRALPVLGFAEITGMYRRSAGATT